MRAERVQHAREEDARFVIDSDTLCASVTNCDKNISIVAPNTRKIHVAHINTQNMTLKWRKMKMTARIH